MAAWWTFREPSLCRHVRRELMRNAVLDCTLDSSLACFVPCVLCMIGRTQRHAREEAMPTLRSARTLSLFLLLSLLGVAVPHAGAQPP